MPAPRATAIRQRAIEGAAVAARQGFRPRNIRACRRGTSGKAAGPGKKINCIHDVLRSKKPFRRARWVADNWDLERNPMELEEPEPIEEYVPGVASGRHYMAKLCHFPDGPWYIEVVHVESLPPLHDSDRTWPTRDEAAKAADKLVADLCG